MSYCGYRVNTIKLFKCQSKVLNVIKIMQPRPGKEMQFLQIIMLLFGNKRILFHIFSTDKEDIRWFCIYGEHWYTEKRTRHCTLILFKLSLQIRIYCRHFWKIVEKKLKRFGTNSLAEMFLRHCSIFKYLWWTLEITWIFCCYYWFAVFRRNPPKLMNSVYVSGYPCFTRFQWK